MECRSRRKLDELDLTYPLLKEREMEKIEANGTSTNNNQ
jgi:hypothetical protein